MELLAGLGERSAVRETNHIFKLSRPIEERVMKFAMLTVMILHTQKL